MRVGILGGSFDPPHLGHLVLADQCRTALGLDELFWIPSFRPPHKTDRVLTGFDLRLEMVRAAIAGLPGAVVSEIERRRGGLSYTVETLRILHAERPADELWLLLGQDSLEELSHWHEPQSLPELARIAAYRRERSRGRTPAFLRRRLRFVDGPRIDVSSSELRRCVRAGGSIRFLVPEPVIEIIRRAHLYHA